MFFKNYLLIFILVTGSSFLQGFDLSSHVDWEDNSLVIRAVVPVVGSAPGNRYEAERKVRESLPDIYLNSVLGICVDSWYSMEDMLKNDPELREKIRLLYAYGVKQNSYFSEDMKNVYVIYKYPLYGEGGIVLPLLNHIHPFPPQPNLDTIPADSFSGLVIYAKGYFDAYGRNEKVRLNPALFLKIYDQGMNVVIEKEMCLPQFLAAWGMAAYSKSIDIKKYDYRIGTHPLKIMIRGIYGKNNRISLFPATGSDSY